MGNKAVEAYARRLSIGQKSVQQEVDKTFTLSDREAELIAETLRDISAFGSELSSGDRKKFLMDLTTLLLPLVACKKTTKKDIKKFLRTFIRKVEFK